MINKLMIDYREKIDCEIDRLFPISNAQYSVVIDAARYCLTLGGKRIRPIIMLEFAKLCGGKEDDVIPFAVALEMIHTYSLIHDDLPCMDNDDMRRGKPSCHIKFGEDTALLAGDTLLTESFGVALKSKANDENKLRALDVLRIRAGADGMIGGQVMDLAFEKMTPDAEALKKMYLLKTGALLSAAAEIGCILSGADDDTINIAREYALNVGLAFQIIDDILDITGDEAVLGKPIGSDSENNKTTFVTLYGLEKAKEIAKDLTDDALNLLKTFNGDTDSLEQLTHYLLNRNY